MKMRIKTGDGHGFDKAGSGRVFERSSSSALGRKPWRSWMARRSSKITAPVSREVSAESPAYYWPGSAL